MDIRLKASLTSTIENWADEHAGDVEWPDVYWGSETSRLMVEAASTVFDAVVEIQEYVLREGFLFEERSA
jgi:hypothetical protein